MSSTLLKTYIPPKELAEHVLKKIRNMNGSLEFPIDPYELIKNDGIILRFNDFEDLEGIIITDERNQTVIGINNNRNYRRQRFTAAHEYCHFLKDINTDNFETEKIICKINSNSKQEKYANDFASHLLMPSSELKKKCQPFLNKNGFISFENITIVAEYFAISFEACVFRVAYEFGYIDGNIDSNVLKRRIGEYKPSEKRIKLVDETNDEILLENMINGSSYNMLNLSKNTGAKFIQNYIYYDNKIEGVILDSEKVNYILADLRYNKENSKYFNVEDEAIVMTLGNLDMQEYLLSTAQGLDIFNTIALHEKLYKYAPFGGEYGGKFRNSDAIIRLGTIQPIQHLSINFEMNKLNVELKKLIDSKDLYTVSNYVKQSIKIMYQFIVIHPFQDGNGRVSRGLLNWMFKLRGIPPIYFDDTSKDEYYLALKEIDLNKNYIAMNILVFKRILKTMISLHQYLFVDEY